MEDIVGDYLYEYELETEELLPATDEVRVVCMCHCQTLDYTSHTGTSRKWDR